MRHPTILNLHLRSWDSHIADLDARPPSAAEGRRAVADTHLALLGVKIVGNGILGDTKDSEGYNRSLQYEREPVRIRRMTDTKDRSGTKELKSYGRKKLPLCEAASVFLLFCREFWGKA